MLLSSEYMNTYPTLQWLLNPISSGHFTYLTSVTQRPRTDHEVARLFVLRALEPAVIPGPRSAQCRSLSAPVEHEDVSQCIGIRVATLGSLVIGRPPVYPGYVAEAEDSVHRDLDTKPHVHHLKVVDPSNETEVIAYAKWEVYPNGRPDLAKLRQPMDPADKEVDQFGDLREAAHDYFCKRNGEMGKRPHIRKFNFLWYRESDNGKIAAVDNATVLALLVTSTQHRKRGAGSLLVKWGIEKSEETGLLAYVQASEQGRRLYSHYGFEDLDTVEFDLSKYGLEGVEVMTEMSRRQSTVREL